MNLKTKIALMSATGLLSVSGMAAYGTYALFTAQAGPTAQKFTAGKLSITAERDDIPQVGPMFYTASTSTLPGVLAIPQWAPGDTNTRGLFLKNNGSLTGRLTTLTASPADSSGNPLTASSSDTTDYNNDITFAKQSNVKIWQLVAYNPSDDEVGQANPGIGSSTYEVMVGIINAVYGKWVEENPGVNPTSDLAAEAKLFNIINQDLVQSINNITATEPDGTTVTNDSVKVVQMASEPLINLMNNSVNVSGMNVKVSPNHAALLAFTVHFDRNPPTGSDVGKNSMQGKSVYFNFGTSWVQTRNNPVVN